MLDPYKSIPVADIDAAIRAVRGDPQSAISATSSGGPVPDVTKTGPPEWLERVYALAAADQHDDAIDIVFEQIDTALCEDRFADVDAALSAADVSRLTTYEMVGFLTITLAARSKLANRSAFIERVAPHLSESLMRGLVP